MPPVKFTNQIGRHRIDRWLPEDFSREDWELQILLKVHHQVRDDD